MIDFRDSPAKKPRLDLQSFGGNEATVLVPSPVEDMKHFYDSSPATREDPLPLETQPGNTVISLEADSSVSNFDLPGLDQPYSAAGNGCASINSAVNYSSKQQASIYDSEIQKITFSSPGISGGNGATAPEILSLHSQAKSPNLVDKAMVTSALRCLSSTVTSDRDFGLLKTMKEVDGKVGSTQDEVNGVEDTQRNLQLTQTPQAQITPGSSASVVVNSPSDPSFGPIDSREPSNKDQHQPLFLPGTSNGTIAGETDFEGRINATKNMLVLADELKADPRAGAVVSAKGGLVVEEEPKITENGLQLYDKSCVPEATVAKAMPEESNGIGAKSSDCDLKMSSIAEAEFEPDSSPYESSSDSSSDASSNDSSEDDYEMLDPAEQARRLMQEDGGSEDEGGKKGAVNGTLRTLNERPDDIVEKPNVTVTTDMKIEELGDVETLVENLVLVKAKTTGEYQVLETGSLLCLQNRTVIGVVADTLGRVQQPHYSIRFTNANAIEQAGISKGTSVYYAPQYSTYVLTQTLKAFKGSDASNIHDEEVGADELEFSDDEAEAEYKRNLKIHKQARRGRRGSASNGVSQVPQHIDHWKDKMETGKNKDVSISYDETSVDDDLYTPLARPSNLHEQLRQEDVSSSSQRGDRNRGSSQGRSRGDSSRSRAGRGGRLRGQAWEQDRMRGPNTGNDRHQPSNPRLNLSLPAMPRATIPAFPMAPPKPAPMIHSAGPPYSPPQQNHYHGYSTGRSIGQHEVPSRDTQASYSYIPQPHYPVYQPPYQHYPQQGPIRPQHYPSQPMSPYGHSLPLYAHGPVSSSYQTPSLPPGAFVNPAFFGNNYQKPANSQPFAPSYEGHSSHQNGSLHNQRH
ncbi:hypothetical protein MMC34_008083 [Xylographa carneopallida]|nr:hypothetical protein [Xylographa carneopallida]